MSRDPFDGEMLGESDDLEIADEVFGADGGHGNASLRSKVSLRERRWQELNNRAPFARISPPSALVGSLGSTVTLTGTQNIQVANWGGDDAESLPVSILIAPLRQLPVPNSTVGPVRLRGIAQFGTRGSITPVEFDIGKGVQFTVPASQVTLQARLESVATAPGGPFPSPQVIISGMLSFYPIVRVQPVTYTDFVDPSQWDAITGTRNSTVPVFAKAVTWDSNDNPGTAQVELTFIDSNNVARYRRRSVVGSNFLGPIELSGDIVQVTVEKLAGDMGFPVGELIYDLEL